MTALLDQPPLFAGTGSHAVTVDRVLVPYVVESAGQLLRRAAEWFTWSCSCGRTSDQSRASHWDLALRVGEGHIGREVQA